MTRHYFDSVGITQKLTLDYERKATSQDQKALEFILANPDMEFTAEDINQYVMPEAPETSPRRALSTLKRMGYIEPVDKRKGKFDRPIIVWRLKEDHRRGQMDWVDNA